MRIMTPVNTRIDVDDLSLSAAERMRQGLRVKEAAITARLEEGELIVDAGGGKVWKYGNAVQALRLTRTEINVLDQRIAELRKENRKQAHLEFQAAQTAQKPSKARRQKEIAEIFVQVAWEEMSPPLFDEFMREAKRRRKMEKANG